MYKFYSHIEKSNVGVALSAALLSMALTPNFFNQIHWGIFIFSSVYSIYGAHRLIKWKYNQLNSDWKKWHEEHHLVLIPILISQMLLAASCWYFFVPITLNITVVIIGTITLMYVLPQPFLTLRSIPFIKAFIVALVWTFVLVILPAQIIKDFPSDILFKLAFFFYFLHLAILSDIKDRNIDPASWKTFPTSFGVNKAIFSSFISVVIAFSLFVISSIDIIGVLTGVLYLFSWYLLERKSWVNEHSYDSFLWILAVFLIFRFI